MQQWIVAAKDKMASQNVEMQDIHHLLNLFNLIIQVYCKIIILQQLLQIQVTSFGSHHFLMMYTGGKPIKVTWS